MTDTAEFNYLKKFTESMVNEINKEFVSMGQSFNIKDNTKNGVFSITLTTKSAGVNRTIALQEFAITISKEIQVFKQYVVMYKKMIQYLMGTGMLVINQAAVQMRTDEEMQKEAKGIFIKQQEN